MIHASLQLFRQETHLDLWADYKTNQFEMIAFSALIELLRGHVEVVDLTEPLAYSNLEIARLYTGFKEGYRISPASWDTPIEKEQMQNAPSPNS